MTRPEGRWYLPIVSSGGIFVICTGVVLLLIMLHALIGPFFVGLAPVEVEQSTGGIHIWEPASSIARGEAEQARRQDAWRTLLAAEASAPVVRDLAELQSEGRPLVVVSDASGLTHEESQALLAHLRGGGSVLLAGWIGASGGAGGDHGVMRSLLDVESVEKLPREASYFVAAARRGPLVAGLLPSERLGLAAESSVPAIDDAGAELVWSDWALRSVGKRTGASRRRSLGRGRLVWLAPSPEAAVWDPGTRDRLRRVVAAAIAWTRREPYAELLAWPGAAPFAGLLAMDSEEGFQTVGRVVAAARLHDLPMTFMVLSDVAREHPELVRAVSRLAEIGSHADVHEGFAGLPYPEQLRRLERSRDDLRALGADSLPGFRPPHEEYDAATERALVAAGFSYMLGDRIAHSMVPRIVLPEGSAADLVEVPRTVADDYELIVTRKIEGTAELAEQMRAGLDRVERRGGLYYFSSHTQFFASPERIELLTDLGELLKQRRAWLASGSELADWWRARAGCSVRAEAVGSHRMLVQATNGGAEALRGLAVRIYMNAPTRSAAMSRTTLFQSPPVLYHVPGSEYLEVVLPELAPGRSYAYHLDFEAGAHP
jgi:peptidoglycan/xylan/chitin deacetylase (PgdA/CDA1 family)